MKNSPPCPLCTARASECWATARDYNYLSSDEEYSYFHCQSCDVLFIDPMPVSQLHIIYPDNYYSFGESKQSFLFNAKDMLDRLSYRRLLSQVEGSRLAALDIGGGHGAQLDVLRRSDARVGRCAIVDLDEKARTIAESKGYEFHLGRIEEFRTDQKFDVILVLNLIEHVQDPLKVLETVRNCLNPGGIALIHTPNFDSLDASLFQKQFWAGLDCPRHWVLFNKQSFIALLKKSGLKVKTFEYTQGASFWGASVVGTLAKLGWIKLSKGKRIDQQHWLFAPACLAGAAFDLLRRSFSKPSQMMFVVQVDAAVQPAKVSAQKVLAGKSS